MMIPNDISNTDGTSEEDEDCSLESAFSGTDTLHNKVTQAKDDDTLTLENETRPSYQEQIQALENQLRVNEEIHAKALADHQAILMEKEQLIQDKKAAIESMKRLHEKNVESLTLSQQQALSSCQMRHDMETSRLKRQLERQEKETKSTAVEQLLNDFEQEQHTRRIYDTDAFFTAQAQSGPIQGPITSKNTPYIRPLYIPTFAISWPAPPPLSSLKKASPVYSKAD